MDFEGFIKLVAGLGFLVFWMLGATKKQRKPGTLQEGTPGLGTTPQLTAMEKMIREALGIVDDRSIADVLPPPRTTGGSRVTSAPVEHMANSLAYDEVKEELRHDRFHQEYLEKHAPTRQAPKGANRLVFDQNSVRSAIVWKEILGPPRSLE